MLDYGVRVRLILTGITLPFTLTHSFVGSDLLD